MALEGAYAFDDAGDLTVFDFSGNGRDIDLTGTGGVQVVGGQTGGALGKTVSGTVSLPTSLRIATESDDRTLMLDALGTRSVWWVRWESVALDTGVFGALSLDAANIIVRARNQANGSPTPAGPTIGTLSASVWHNFCTVYVRGSGVLSYYYDGALVGTTSFPAGTQLYVGADDLNIAEWGSTGPAIDNLRFFSHALSATEVAELAGTPVTATSGGAIDGTGAAELGGLSASATAVRATSGTAGAGLGALTATTTGRRATTGSSTATLGRLAATVTVAAEVTGERIRVSGREPYRNVSGREPRTSI